MMVQCQILTFFFLVYFTPLVLQYNIDGALILSPSPRAHVCNAGDILELTCNTTESVLQWSLSLKGMSDPTDIAISPTTVGTRREMINTSRITVTRISGRGETPLISMLVINPVTESLNGTLNISCRLIGLSTSMATTTVNIINPGNRYHPSSPMVRTEHEFRPDSITISLMWSQEIHDNFQIPVSYRVSVQPVMKATVTMVDSTVINITLLYNTLYNVSVLADFCGRRNTTMLVGIYYINCGAPLDESTSSVLVSGYNDVALEGDSVSLACSSGLVLSGPNSSTCTGNGKWEPDPRRSACHKNHHNNNISSIANSHPPLSEAGKIAIASVSVFLVTFALAFTVGFVTGHCCHKKSSDSAEMNVSPLYDTIQLNQVEHPKRDVPMSENIAYSAVKLTTVTAN